LDGTDLRVFASGLRNTVFFTFDKNGTIWGNDMGRDFLGDNLPPDELNTITENANYGWPYCYGDLVRDDSFMKGQKSDYCSGTKAPVFKYHAHVAPLGIAFINSPLFNSTDQGDILVAFHGSWNSTKPVGYKVVKLNVEGGEIKSMEDFITGWIRGDAVYGRPVDLVFDKTGYLYISDDKAGVVYVVSKE
jgi:glucose/arabinose dehydrogenase